MLFVPMGVSGMQPSSNLRHGMEYNGIKMGEVRFGTTETDCDLIEAAS